MNKRVSFFVFLCVCLLVSGCRSDADRMAEFCFGLDEVAQKTTDCVEMAHDLNALIDAHSARLADDAVCASTPACRPCRPAVRVMLRECGYDPAFETALRRMHFSDALRPNADD